MPRSHFAGQAEYSNPPNAIRTGRTPRDNTAPRAACAACADRSARARERESIRAVSRQQLWCTLASAVLTSLARDLGFNSEKAHSIQTVADSVG